MWQVELDRRAARELRALPDDVLPRVTTRLLKLEQDPFARGCKKLQGGRGYRLHVGDYRVVYAVGHRKDVDRK